MLVGNGDMKKNLKTTTILSYHWVVEGLDPCNSLDIIPNRLMVIVISIFFSVPSFPTSK